MLGHKRQFEARSLLHTTLNSFRGLTLILMMQSALEKIRQPPKLPVAGAGLYQGHLLPQQNFIFDDPRNRYVHACNEYGLFARVPGAHMPVAGAGMEVLAAATEFHL